MLVGDTYWTWQLEGARILPRFCAMCLGVGVPAHPDILQRYARHAYVFVEHLAPRNAKEGLEAASMKIAAWNAAGLPDSHLQQCEQRGPRQPRPLGCGFPYLKES